LKDKNVLSIISKLFYVIAVLMFMIAYFIGGAVILGFTSLLIAAISGLITELLRNKKIIMIIIHVLIILLSLYILFSVILLVFFMASDVLPTLM